MKSSSMPLRKCSAVAALLLTLTAYSPAFAEGEDEKYFDSLLDAADKVGLVDEIKDKLDPTKGVRDSMQEQSEALQTAMKENLESEVLRLLYEKYGYDTVEKAEAAYKKITAIFDTINSGLDWTDYAIGKYSQVANGQYDQLAVDLWKEGLNKAASTEMAKEIFAKLGVGSNVVGLAVKALELTADSYIALRNETKGAKLEALYGALEGDKKLFRGASSGRKLGEGSPIPVTKESVDYLYNRIATESGFRGQFQIYYEQQLNRTFPTPDFFASMWIAYQTGGGGKAGAAVAEATQEALKKNQGEIEEGIRALLAQLNAEAKAREAAVVAQKQLEEIKRIKDQLLTLKVQARFRADNAKAASGQVPAMEAFLAKIPSDVQEARKAKSPDKLGARRANIVEYVRGPVKALPQGKVRRDLVSKFRSAWITVSKAKLEIQKEADEAYKSAEVKRIADSYSAGSIGANVANRADYGLAPQIKFSVQLKDLTTDVDRAINSQEINKTSGFELLDKAKADARKDLDLHYQNTKARREKVLADFNGRAVRAEESAAESISWAKYGASINATVNILETRFSELRSDFDGYAEQRRAKLVAEESSLQRTLEILGNEVSQFVQMVAADSIPLFRGLQSISYAGLPAMAPPKWDAIYPAKLREYLLNLLRNVEKEKEKVVAVKAVWDSAKQRADIVLAPANKPMAAEFRSRLTAIRSMYSQRRIPLGTNANIIEFIESNLKTFDTAYQLANNINFKPAEDQAGAPDVERAYVQGLINQVETITSMLSRYSLVTVKHRGSTVTLATQGSGVDLGLSDPSRVMTADQIKQLPAQLTAAVDAIGFSSFDEKATVGLKAFIASEFAKYQQASGLNHLAAYYSAGELNVVTDQDLKGLLSTINAIATNGSLVSNVNDALKAKETSALDMSLNYGVGDKPPTFNLGKLQQILSAKDGDIQATARAIQSAVATKIVEYGKWQQAEAKRADDNAKMVAECSKKGGIILDGKCANIGGPGGTGLAQNQPPGIGTVGTVTRTQPVGGPNASAVQAGPATGRPAAGPAEVAGPAPGSTGSPPGAAASPTGAKAPMAASGTGSGEIGTPAVPPSGKPQQELTNPIGKAVVPPSGLPNASTSTGIQAESRIGPLAQATIPSDGITARPAAPNAGTSVQTPESSVRKPDAPPALPTAPAGQSISTVPTQSNRAGLDTLQRPQPTLTASNSNIVEQSGRPQAAPGGPSGQQVMPQSASPGSQGGNAETSRSTSTGLPSITSLPAPSTQSQAPPKSATPGAPAKPVDKDLEAQWKEMNKADSKPPIVTTGPATTRPTGAQATPTTPQTSGPSAQPVPSSADATPAIRDLYQKFAEAYQRKDARGMTKYMADQWQGAGGQSLHDFEEGLGLAFKSYESIQIKLDSLQIQKAANDTYNVTYTAGLSAKSGPQKLDEKVNMADVVKLTVDGPRIAKSSGSILVKAKAQGPAAGAAPSQPQPPGQVTQAADATPAIREVYQKFADAYQRKDARSMMKFLSDQWQGPGGMSVPDFEDGLSNSFKIFDSVQFKVEALQIQKSGADSFNVSYAVILSGKNSKQKIDDRINIQDVVKITAEGPRIVKTMGSVVMKPK